jgi:hypothetical protein
MKTLLLVLVARMVGSTGNVLLAKGMKTIGDLRTRRPRCWAA